MFVVRKTIADPASNAVPASCEQAFRDYAQDVARWASHLGGADVDVEDVVQEVFFVVSKRLAEFRPEARFSSWLFEITRKIVANHRRRQRWRFWGNDSQQALAAIPSQLRDPAAEVERQQLVARFYAALDRLPEKYRTVLVLYEIEGLSTQAIAELRHLKLGTVKVQLGRARERLVAHYRRLVQTERS
jgi:RNA polymerase sigma-70 factor (ECF subfamily)